MLQSLNKDNNKVLFFTQGRQMLDVMETYVRSQGYSYLRMDGETPIRQVWTLGLAKLPLLW